ncbi:MAG: hypothetical protein EA384_09125 [Spirochaetaceae bacterium]|nr:MAG: hypothetical protein EA384_09125 [Spirochaetaceae bacterium]
MSTRADYKQRFGGDLGYYEGRTFETVGVLKPVQFYDDFTGADLVFLETTATPGEGCVWTKKIVGEAPPTVAKTANATNGLVAAALTAAEQKQDAAVHMNDQKEFSIAQGAIFEARAALTALPTGNGVASLGLWSDWVDGGAARRVGFEIAADLKIVAESDDGADDINEETGIEAELNKYYIFRIDCSVQADIKFYIDGVRVAGGTTFANAANAANSKCQPHLGMYKSGGTGVGTLSVDYVRVWQNRS